MVRNDKYVYLTEFSIGSEELHVYLDTICSAVLFSDTMIQFYVVKWLTPKT